MEDYLKCHPPWRAFFSLTALGIIGPCIGSHLKSDSRYRARLNCYLNYWLSSIAFTLDYIKSMTDKTLLVG